MQNRAFGLVAPQSSDHPTPPTTAFTPTPELDLLSTSFLHTSTILPSILLPRLQSIQHDGPED
jgi:hypothetical protein